MPFLLLCHTAGCSKLLTLEPEGVLLLNRLPAWPFLSLVFLFGSYLFLLVLLVVIRLWHFGLLLVFTSGDGFFRRRAHEMLGVLA